MTYMSQRQEDALLAATPQLRAEGWDVEKRPHLQQVEFIRCTGYRVKVSYHLLPVEPEKLIHIVETGGTR